MVINSTNINKTNNHLLASLTCFVLTHESISASDFVLCQYTFIDHIYLSDIKKQVYVQYDICIEYLSVYTNACVLLL